MEPTFFYVGIYFLVKSLHLASCKVSNYNGWNNSPNTQYHIQTDEGEERYFKYQTKSGQYRKEKRLQDGTVVGTYGWVDPNGYLRLRDYVADNQGYRVIKSKLIYVGKDSISNKSVPDGSPSKYTPEGIPFEPAAAKQVDSHRVYTPKAHLPSGNYLYSSTPLTGGYEVAPSGPPKASAKPLTIFVAPPRSALLDYESTSSSSEYAATFRTSPTYAIAAVRQVTPPTPASGKFLHLENIDNYLKEPQGNKLDLTPAEKQSEFFERDSYNHYGHPREYDGISTVQNGFRYYLPRHYHEETVSDEGKERAGSFGYIDPFGIRRVIYYNTSPGKGFIHKKNNRFVGFSSTPYDPRPNL